MLGISPPALRVTAGRKARPKPLNKDSIMWWVLSPFTDMWSVAPSVVAERLEEVADEFAGKSAHFFAREFRIEDEVRATAEVDRHFRFRLVHGHGESVPADAAFVAEGLLEGGAKREADVLDRVVLVDVQVAIARNHQADARVARDLVEHVVEETKAGRKLRRRDRVEVHGDGDFVSLVWRAMVARRGASAIWRAISVHPRFFGL